MSKKDFEALAWAIRESAAITDPPGTPGYTAVAALARRIADYCGATNPRFDRARFLRASGVED